ncbi:GMC oxidoreductase [Nostoc flagelliforme]|nr:GMC oxidoreductase [Nostoc flagelliforme]
MKGNQTMFDVIIVDASIWPDVPSVATAFPTMMLAESIAARMA